MITNLKAALIFFTRLPFWRIFSVPNDSFKQVINYWAPVGWLTGGVMALVLWLSGQVFPHTIAVLLAILARLLLTGALHEDGLADFFDGFGGGTTRERTLAIMKDSHIGTYGVIALIFYFAIFGATLHALPSDMACFFVLSADPLGKLIASQITRFLPYARTEATGKAGVVYNSMKANALVISLIFGLLPMLLFFPALLWLAVIAPILVFGILTMLMKRKIAGYTGDCCGALFLMCELSFILAILAIL